MCLRRASPLNNAAECGALQTRPQVHTEALTSHSQCSEALQSCYILFYSLLYTHTQTHPAYWDGDCVSWPHFLISCAELLKPRTCMRTPHKWTNSKQAGMRLPRPRFDRGQLIKRRQELKRLSCVCRVSCQALPYANVPFICVIEQ